MSFTLPSEGSTIFTKDPNTGEITGTLQTLEVIAPNTGDPQQVPNTPPDAQNVEQSQYPSLEQRMSEIGDYMFDSFEVPSGKTNIPYPSPEFVGDVVSDVAYGVKDIFYDLFLQNFGADQKAQSQTGKALFSILDGMYDVLTDIPSFVFGIGQDVLEASGLTNATPEEQDNWDKLFGNAAYEFFDLRSEEFKAKTDNPELTSMTSEQKQNEPWYIQATRPDFWTEEAADGLGSFLGFILPGAGTSGAIVKGLTLTKNLPFLAKMAARVVGSIAGAEAMTMLEGVGEAHQTFEEVKERNLEAYKKELENKGLAPEQIESQAKERALKDAANAASYVLSANHQVLLSSNAAELFLMLLPYKGGSIVSNLGKGVATLFGAGLEGGQEGFQWAIQERAKEMFQPTDKDVVDWSVFDTSYVDVAKKGWRESNPEMMKSIFIGAALGGGAQATNAVQQYMENENRYKNLKGVPTGSLITSLEQVFEYEDYTEDGVAKKRIKIVDGKPVINQERLQEHYATLEEIGQKLKDADLQTDEDISNMLYNEVLGTAIFSELENGADPETIEDVVSRLLNKRDDKAPVTNRTGETISSKEFKKQRQRDVEDAIGAWREAHKMAKLFGFNSKEKKFFFDLALQQAQALKSIEELKIQIKDLAKDEEGNVINTLLETKLKERLNKYTTLQKKLQESYTEIKNEDYIKHNRKQEERQERLKKLQKSIKDLVQSKDTLTPEEIGKIKEDLKKEEETLQKEIKEEKSEKRKELLEDTLKTFKEKSSKFVEDIEKGNYKKKLNEEKAQFAKIKQIIDEELEGFENLTPQEQSNKKEEAKKKVQGEIWTKEHADYATEYFNKKLKNGVLATAKREFNNMKERMRQAAEKRKQEQQEKRKAHDEKRKNPSGDIRETAKNAERIANLYSVEAVTHLKKILSFFSVLDEEIESAAKKLSEELKKGLYDTNLLITLQDGRKVHIHVSKSEEGKNNIKVDIEEPTQDQKLIEVDLKTGKAISQSIYSTLENLQGITLDPGITQEVIDQLKVDFKQDTGVELPNNVRVTQTAENGEVVTTIYLDNLEASKTINGKRFVIANINKVRGIRTTFSYLGSVYEGETKTVDIATLDVGGTEIKEATETKKAETEKVEEKIEEVKVQQKEAEITEASEKEAVDGLIVSEVENNFEQSILRMIKSLEQAQTEDIWFGSEEMAESISYRNVDSEGTQYEFNANPENLLPGTTIKLRAIDKPNTVDTNFETYSESEALENYPIGVYAVQPNETEILIGYLHTASTTATKISDEEKRNKELAKLKRIRETLVTASNNKVSATTFEIVTTVKSKGSGIIYTTEAREGTEKLVFKTLEQLPEDSYHFAVTKSGATELAFGKEMDETLGANAIIESKLPDTIENSLSPYLVVLVRVSDRIINGVQVPVWYSIPLKPVSFENFEAANPELHRKLENTLKGSIYAIISKFGIENEVIDFDKHLQFLQLFMPSISLADALKDKEEDEDISLEQLAARLKVKIPDKSENVLFMTYNKKNRTFYFYKKSGNVNGYNIIALSLKSIEAKRTDAKFINSIRALLSAVQEEMSISGYPRIDNKRITDIAQKEITFLDKWGNELSEKGVTFKELLKKLYSSPLRSFQFTDSAGKTVNRIVIQPRIQMDLSNFNAEEPSQEEKEFRITNRQELEDALKTGIKLNESRTAYEDEDGNEFKRASTFIDENADVFNVTPFPKTKQGTSAERGTAIDTVIREYLENPELTAVEIAGRLNTVFGSEIAKSGVTSNVKFNLQFGANLKSILDSFLTTLKDKGLVFTSKEVSFSVEVNNEKIAGTTDIIAYSPASGKYYIIDIKTSTRDRAENTKIYENKDIAQQNIYRKALANHLGISEDAISLHILPLQITQAGATISKVVLSTAPSSKLPGTLDVSTDRTIDEFFKKETKKEEDVEETDDAVDAEASPSVIEVEDVSSDVVIESIESIDNVIAEAENEDANNMNIIFNAIKGSFPDTPTDNIIEALQTFETFPEFFEGVGMGTDEKLLETASKVEYGAFIQYLSGADNLKALAPLTQTAKEAVRFEVENNEFIISGLTDANLKDLLFDGFAFIVDAMLSKPGTENVDTSPKAFKEAFELYIKELRALLPSTEKPLTEIDKVKLLAQKARLERSIKELNKRIQGLTTELDGADLSDPKVVIMVGLLDTFKLELETAKAKLDAISIKVGANTIANKKLLIVLKTKNLKKLERLLEQMFKEHKGAIENADKTDLEGENPSSNEDGTMVPSTENLPETDDDGATDSYTAERIFGQDVGVENPLSSIPALLRAKLSNINDMTKTTFGVEDGMPVRVEPKPKLNFLGRPRKVPYQEAFYAIKALLSNTPNDIDSILDKLKDSVDAYPWLPQLIRELETAKESNKKYVQQFTAKMPSHSMTMLGVITKAEIKDGKTTYTSYVYNSNSNEASRILVDNWVNSASFTEVFKTVDGEVIFDRDKAKTVVETIQDWRRKINNQSIDPNSETITVTQKLSQSDNFNPNDVWTSSRVVLQNVTEELLNTFFHGKSGRSNKTSIPSGTLVQSIKEKLNSSQFVEVDVSASVTLGKKSVQKPFTFKISKNADGSYTIEQYKKTVAKLISAAEIVSTLGMLGIELSVSTVEKMQERPLKMGYKKVYFTDLIVDASGVFYGIESLLTTALGVAGQEASKFVPGQKILESLYESHHVKRLAEFEVVFGGIRATPSNFRESKKQLHTYTKRKMITDKIMHILDEIEKGKIDDKDGVVFGLLSSIFTSDSEYLKLLMQKDNDLAEELRTKMTSPAHSSLNVLKQQAKDYILTKKLKDLPKIEQEFVQLVFFLESGTSYTSDIAFEDITGEQKKVRIGKSVRHYFVPKMSDKDTEIILPGIGYEFNSNSLNNSHLFGISSENVKIAEALYIDRVIFPELKRIVHSLLNSSNYKSKEYKRGSKLFMNTPILDSIVPDGLGKTFKKHIVDYVRAKSSETKEDGSSYSAEEIAKEILEDKTLKLFGKNIFRHAASETIENEAKSRLALWIESNLIEKTEKGGVSGLLYIDDKKFSEILSGATAENKVKYLAYIMSFNTLIDAAEQQMLILGDPAHKSKIGKQKFIDIVEAFENGSIVSEGNQSIKTGNITTHVELFTLKNAKDENVLTNVTREQLSEIWTDISKHSYINTGKRLANLIAPGERGVEKGHLFYFPIKDIEAPSYVRNSVLATLNGKTLEEIEKMSEEQLKNLIGWKAYTNINTADGQELGTWQEGLHFRYTKGDLSYAQMQQLKQAIETKKTYDEFTDEEKELSKILLFGKTHQPDKLVYTGHNYEGVENPNEKGILRELYVKSSTIYLFPQLTAGREIDKVRIFMEKVQAKLTSSEELGNGLVRFPFESAVKIGLKESPLEIFNSQGEYMGEQLEKEIEDTDKFKAFVSKYGIKAARKHLREQLSVTNKSGKPFGAKNIRGSQGAKLIWADVLNGGEGNKPINGFKFRGKEVSGRRLYKIYVDTYNQIYTHKRTELLEELGIDSRVSSETFEKMITELATQLAEKGETKEKTEENVKAKVQELFSKSPKEVEIMLLNNGFNPYVSHNMRKQLAKNISKLIHMLSQEAKARGYDISAQDGLKFRRGEEKAISSSQLNLPLWMSSNSDTFEALLNAVVSNRIHKILFPGYSYVLVSDVVSKKVKKPITETAEFIAKNKEQIIWTKPEYANLENLKGHHVDANGKVNPDQIIVQSKFMGNDGKVINLHAELESLRATGNLNATGQWIKLVNGVPTLNMENFDEKLLTIFGFRIPTSGLMSMAAIEIVGFVHPTAGDIVVAPRDLIVRMGSDFDIDKLYSYMRNHMTQDGKLKSLTEEDLESYIEYFLKEERERLTQKYTDEGLTEELIKENVEKELQKKREKLLSKFSSKFYLDKVLDIHLSVLTNPNPTIQQNILTPLDTEKASESAEYIRSLTSKKPKKAFTFGGQDFEVSKKGFSPLSSLFQIDERIAANSFKTGISVKSLNSTLHATMQQADSAAFYEYQNDGKDTRPASRTMRVRREVKRDDGSRVAIPESVSLFGVESDGSFGNSKTLIQTGTNQRKYLISFVNAEEQQTMLDGKKLDIAGAVNDTQITFPYRRALTLLGFYGLNVTDAETAETHFVRIGDIISMQPVIVEFIKRLEEVQGQLKDFTEDAFNKIAKDLFEELKDDTGTLPDSDIDLKNANSVELAMSMISKNYSDAMTDSERVLQYQVLSNFLLLTAIGNKLGTVQTLINADSKRADKSIFVNIEKIRTILNIAKEKFNVTVDGEKISLEITGLENLLGQFIVVTDKDIADAMKNRQDNPDKVDVANELVNKSRKLDKSAFYLETVITGDTIEHVFLRPYTVNGLATAHVLGTAANIYESLFPYQAEQFEKVYNRLSELTGMNKRSVNQRAYFRRLLFQEFRKHLVSRSAVQRVTPGKTGITSALLPYTFDPSPSSTGYDISKDKDFNRFKFLFNFNGTEISAVDLIHLYLKGYISNGFSTANILTYPPIVTPAVVKEGNEDITTALLREKTKSVIFNSKEELVNEEGKDVTSLIITNNDLQSAGVRVNVDKIEEFEDKADGKTKYKVTVSKPEIQPISTGKDLKNFPRNERDAEVLGIKGFLDNEGIIDHPITINGKTIKLAQVYQSFKLALFGIEQDSNDFAFKALYNSKYEADSDGILRSINNVLSTGDAESKKLRNNIIEVSKITLAGKEYHIFSPNLHPLVFLFIKLRTASYLRNVNIANYQGYDEIRNLIEQLLSTGSAPKGLDTKLDDLINKAFNGKATLKPDSIKNAGEVVRSPLADRSRGYRLVQNANPKGSSKIRTNAMNLVSLLAPIQNSGFVRVPINEVHLDPTEDQIKGLNQKRFIFTGVNNDNLLTITNNLTGKNDGGFFTFEAPNGIVYKAQFELNEEGARKNLIITKFDLEEEYQKMLQKWAKDNPEKLEELKQKLETSNPNKKLRLFESTPFTKGVNRNTHEYGLAKLLNETFASKETVLFSEFPDEITLESLGRSAFATLEFSGIVDNKKNNNKFFFLKSDKINKLIEKGVLIKDNEKIKGTMYKNSIMIYGEFYTVKDLVNSEGQPVTVIVVDNPAGVVDQYNAYLIGANKASTGNLIYHEGLEQNLEQFEFDVSGIDEMREQMFFDDFGKVHLPIFNDSVMNTTTSQIIILVKGTEKYNQIVGETVPETDVITHDFLSKDGLVRNIYVVDNVAFARSPKMELEKLKTLAENNKLYQFKFALYQGLGKAPAGVSDLEIQREISKIVFPENLYFPMSEEKNVNHTTEEQVGNFTNKMSPVTFSEVKIKKKEGEGIHTTIFNNYVVPETNLGIRFYAGDEQVESSSSYTIKPIKITANFLPDYTGNKNLDEILRAWTQAGSSVASQFNNLSENEIRLGISSIDIYRLKTAFFPSLSSGFEFLVKDSKGTTIKLTLQEFLDLYALPAFFKAMHEGAKTLQGKSITAIHTTGATGIEEALIKAAATIKFDLRLTNLKLNVFVPSGYSYVREGVSAERVFPGQSAFKKRYNVKKEMKRESFPRFFKGLISNIDNIPVLNDYVFVNDKKRWSFELHEGRTESLIKWNNSLQTGENSNFYASFARMLADNRRIMVKDENGNLTQLTWNNGSTIPEPLTVSRLAQYMILYENLRSGGVQKAKEFAKFIPPFYYNLIGATASLNSLDLTDPLVLGRKENGVSSFERTFIQTHPKYAKVIRETESMKFEDYFDGLKGLKSPYSAPQVVKLSPKGKEVLGGKYENYPKFISIYDTTIKEYVIYEMLETSEEISYQRIASYRQKKVSMYNSDLGKRSSEISNVDRMEKSIASYGLSETGKTSVLEVLSRIVIFTNNPYFKQYAEYLKRRINQIQSENIPINLEFVDNIDNGKTLAQISFRHDDPLAPMTFQISRAYLKNISATVDFNEFEETLLHELGHIDDVYSLRKFMNFSKNPSGIFDTSLKVLPDNATQKEKNVHETLTKLEKLYKKLHAVANNPTTPEETVLQTAYRSRLSAYSGKNLYEFITEVRTDKELQKAMNNVIYNSGSTFLDAFKKLISKALNAIRAALGVEVRPNSMLYEALGLIEELKYNVSETASKSNTTVSTMISADGVKYSVKVSGNTISVTNLETGEAVLDSQEGLKNFVESLTEHTSSTSSQRTVEFFTLNSEDSDVGATPQIVDPKNQESITALNTLILDDNKETVFVLHSDKKEAIEEIFGTDSESGMFDKNPSTTPQYLYFQDKKGNFYEFEFTDNYQNYKVSEISSIDPNKNLAIINLSVTNTVNADQKRALDKLINPTVTTLTRLQISSLRKISPQAVDKLNELIKNNTIKRKDCN